jgi:hypothetical protein
MGPCWHRAANRLPLIGEGEVMRRISKLAGVAAAAAFAGVTVMSVSAPAGSLGTFAQEDPACGWLGWAHPACAGGAFDSPVADDGIPGDNAAEGGIPAPAMVPNVDGTLSLPGTPGAV